MSKVQLLCCILFTCVKFMCVHHARKNYTTVESTCTLVKCVNPMPCFFNSTKRTGCRQPHPPPRHILNAWKRLLILSKLFQYWYYLWMCFTYVLCHDLHFMLMFSGHLLKHLFKGGQGLTRLFSNKIINVTQGLPSFLSRPVV